MSDLEAGLTAIADARPGYEKARHMYDGTVHEVFASELIARQLSATSGHYKVNLARKPVTAVLNKLKINAVTCVENEALTKTLNEELWDANQLELDLPDAFEKACSRGDAYLLFWPSDGATVTDSNKVDKVTAFIHEPTGVRAFYETDNPRKMKYVIRTWVHTVTTSGRTERYQRVDLWYDRTEQAPGRIERYISVAPLSEGNGDAPTLPKHDADFRRYTGDEDDDNIDSDGNLINPWGLGVWAHLRTARPYGRPVHVDAYGTQNALNKLVAVHLDTTDELGFPTRHALNKSGTAGSNQSAGLADYARRGADSPGDQAPPRQGGAVKSRPGTVTKWSNTDALIQFPGADQLQFLAAIDKYARLLGTVTDTPIDGLDEEGGPESGASRRARNETFFSRVEKLQLSFRAALIAWFRVGMEMLGYHDVRCDVEWKPSEKVSSIEGWQAVQAQQDAGVPEKASLLEAGYLPEEVMAWGVPLDRRIDQLQRIATVLQGLGAAGQFTTPEGQPMVGPDIVMQLIQAFLTEVRDSEGEGVDE